MKKIIAVSALLAASFAVPTLPAQAQNMVDWATDNSNCWVLGVLKRDCWEAARAAWEDGRDGAAMGFAAVADGAGDAADAAEDAAARWGNWRWGDWNWLD